MRSFGLGSLLLSCLLGAGPARAEAPLEVRRSPARLNVRATAALDGALIGQIELGVPFSVLARVAGEGCGGDGWGRVEAGGFACLDGAGFALDAPADLPALIDFNAPSPSEIEAYEETGQYSGRTRSPMLPYIYGKRAGRWGGAVWASEADWLTGAPSVDRLDARHAYSFVSVIETVKGRAFLRANGSLVPEAELYLFPLTEFHGRDLAARPIREGTVAAWVVAESGARLRDKPSVMGEEIGRLPYQSELELEARPVGDGRWWEIAEALGPGRSGYVSGIGLARIRAAPRPVEVGPEERWVDINLDQQTMALMRGEVPLFVTLISSGVTAHDTPRGTFRVTDKQVTNDMSSLSGARERYMVEDVPWVVHFKPRYAIHTAFWHWDLGHKTSHGCVNLSPKDARTVFNWVEPVLPPGFHSIQASPDTPGMVVRIRAR